MPVTAVLSKKFYETFGEDMTNELVTWFNTVDATYRADINRLNDLNFQRFEATLKQALAELKTDMLKWMFGFWATTTLATIGTALGVVSLLLRR
jgi:hypothetical protein